MLSPSDTYKSRVRQAFSRHAGTYDLHAGIQVHAAEHSAQLLSMLKMKSAIPDGDILEVGCGTGLFSHKLLSQFHDRQITFSDISSEMLEACKLRLRSHAGIAKNDVEFRTLDAEELEGAERYAVIASSFAIQWFFNPIDGITRLVRALKPGGVLLFSVPGDDSCPEWRAAAHKLQVPFTRNPMPHKDDLQKLAARNTMEFRLQDHIVEETFADSASMMRSMKELGAGTQRNNLQLSCMQLRRLLKELDRNGNPLRASYQVIAGHFRKVNA